MTADRLTVLTSVNRRLASKTFSQKKDGTIQNRSYGNEKYFSVTAIEVAGIGELARALEGLSRNPHAFVVRGEPLPGIDRKRTRRLLHPDRKTGEPATFTEAPRRWALVDVDEIACPAAIDPKSDPEDAVEHVIGLLPAELHDAWCWWQLSSSQSVFSDTTISMHLWVWLDAPLGGDELKRWAIAANQSAGYKLIDPALFSAVQAHYVAAPDFVAPLPDPLPRRCGLRQGLDDSVSLIIPPPHPKRRDEFGTEGYEPGRGVKAYLDTIGGPAGFRGPIKKAIASYIATYGSKADCGPLKAAIRRALDRAEPDWRKDPKGVRYTDDEHLDDIIAAIRAFQGDKPGKGSQPEPPPWLDDPPPAEPEERDELDPDPPDEDIGPLPAEFSDEALALQFTAYHHADWRYVALWGKWMQWLGTYWRSEDTLRAFELARRVCRRNSPQAALISEKLGREVAGAGTVAGVERLARADRRHAMTFDQWNADDWSINQPQRKE
jgi:D5 N terminal like